MGDKPFYIIGIILIFLVVFVGAWHQSNYTLSSSSKDDVCNITFQNETYGSYVCVNCWKVYYRDRLISNCNKTEQIKELEKLYNYEVQKHGEA